MEAAIAAHGFAAERERLVNEVAREVWRGQGGTVDAYPSDSTTALALEVVIAPMLTEPVLLTSLALRYLDVLEFNLATADYEDVPGLRAEVAWVVIYLSGQLRHSDAKGEIIHLVEQGRPFGQTRAGLLAVLLAGHMAKALGGQALAA